MEKIRDNFVSSLDHQSMQVQEDIRNLEELLKTKCDHNQARSIVENEFQRKIDPFKREMDQIKRAISSNQEEIERVDAQAHRKIENLDYNIQDKLQEISLNFQKGPAHGANDIDRKIAKLNQESEIYNQNMIELKNSLKEVQEVFESLQNEPKFNQNDARALRLESKISFLQNQIQSLSSQVERNAYSRPMQNQRSVTPSHSPGAISQVTSPNVTAIAGITSQYNRYNTVEGFKENVSSFTTRNEERNHQAKSPNEREYQKSSHKSPYMNDYSPYSNKGNTSGSRDQQGSGTKYRQITSLEVKSVGIPINTSQKKYYGDPKVKSIIEEFYKNKKLNQNSSASKSIPNEVDSERNYPRADDVIARVTFSQQGVSSIQSDREKPALEFQPNFGGVNQPRDNILHSRNTSYFQGPDYGHEHGNIRLDQYKDGNFSLGSKSATSNLSMTYSTINPKFESTIRTDEFMSPQGSYRINIEEDKRGISGIRPVRGEYSNLKKNTEQDFLANQFLQTQEIHSQLLQTKQDYSQPISKEHTLKTRQSARTSGGETQFHDAVDHFSDFDVNEMNEGNNMGPKDIEKYGNVYYREQENNEEQVTNIHNNQQLQEGNNKTSELDEKKKKNDEKILAQIDYFIYGKLSNILNEEDEEDIYCNLDDDGFVFDEDGEFVLNKEGNKVQLTPEEIEKFNNNNMIE